MNTGSNNQGAKSVFIKSPSEIAYMYEANQIVAEILFSLERVIEAGITTQELDQLAEGLCVKYKAKPAFKGYRGFPACLCVSINEEVVHGIPSRKRRLNKGDIVSLDFGVCFQGFFGDSALTVPVGAIDSGTRKLLDVTEKSLDIAIEQAQAGNRISDISKTVQKTVEESGFSVVRQFVGHGIGKSLHEGPEIPNFVQRGSSPRIVEGMVLAIEPMVNTGTYDVQLLKDGWTVVTADKMKSAHFEHCVAVTANGPVVLSLRKKVVYPEKN